ncbi:MULTISPECIES: biliverdin-producing heme oxygenase [Stenotrophomonas]|uniref:Biliverdin-producing heme oxygenase n=1 Tax=Stenotrophomonas lactitubi TaxID=2045214 RepID=A0AAW4GLM1_9GAMM|nr:MULTISPECIES: biliverdin-producing heme oxygenase [Stenotrophomonas]MBM9914985.1 biliverdin-producing heme oxygenase [Stenotrophomonas lactitubi]MBM9922425.1 biliverdin-producing heme oxygenase [Stenotrophomonas lactitubi]MBM9936758.1 biliverdin-producing heme oxygenase [Stenotrophomonas lactitubi]
MTVQTSLEDSRSVRLKAATRDSHGALDKRIMAGDIFADRSNFARFLRVQYRFHRSIDALYASPALDALLPDLAERRRLQQVRSDLQDLEQALPGEDIIALGNDLPLPTALGWLYVAEGSNLGGTVLYKMAAALGLDRDFGARHLAAHPDGAARHWRGFTAALDAVVLSPAQEQEVIDAADAAFRSVHGHVEVEFS